MSFHFSIIPVLFGLVLWLSSLAMRIDNVRFARFREAILDLFEMAKDDTRKLSRTYRKQTMSDSFLYWRAHTFQQWFWSLISPSSSQFLLKIFEEGLIAILKQIFIFMTSRNTIFLELLSWIMSFWMELL